MSNIDTNHLVNERVRIGETLRKRRESFQLSADAVATVAGISAKTILKIESGAWNYSIDFINSYGVHLGFRLALISNG